MRKFILMLALSLGGIVSTQAQTFDFSCDQVTDNGGATNSWTVLSENFTESQMVTLTSAGYVMSEDGDENEQLLQTFPDVSYTYINPPQPNGDPGIPFTFQTDAVVSIQTGVFYHDRNGIPNEGPFTYKVSVTGGTFQNLDFFNEPVDVIDFVLSLYPPAPQPTTSNYVAFNGVTNRLDFQSISLTTDYIGEGAVDGVVDVFIIGTPGAQFEGNLTIDFLDDSYDGVVYGTDPTDVTFHKFTEYIHATGELNYEGGPIQELRNGRLVATFPAEGMISSINVLVQSEQSDEVGAYGFTKRYRFVGGAPHVPAGFSDEQVNALFGLGLLTSEGLNYFYLPYGIGGENSIIFDPSISRQNGVSISGFEVRDEYDEISSGTVTFEAALEFIAPYLSIDIPEVAGFELAQTIQLIADGFVHDTNFGELHTSGLVGTNSDDRQFIVRPAVSGAQRDLHDGDGNVIGRGSYTYTITGWNVTPEYFNNVDDATERAISLNQ